MNKYETKKSKVLSMKRFYIKKKKDSPIYCQDMEREAGGSHSEKMGF